LLATLFGLGWALGSAQTSQPDFELIVNAPAGGTSIECVRGCDLSWVQRGLNATATATSTFTFKCSGDSEGRCSSGKVGGWIKQ
jgi:hypothetical protein